MPEAGMGAATTAATTTATPVVANGELGNGAEARKPASSEPSHSKAKRSSFQNANDAQLFKAFGGEFESEGGDAGKEDDPVARGVAAAEKSPADEAREEAEKERAEQPRKKKYKVGEAEIELEEEKADRYVQKGIFYEKKAHQLQQAEQRLSAFAQQLEQRAQQIEAKFEALKTGDPTVLEELLGDKARDLAEAYLRPKIERELMDPHERAIIEAKERAEKAEAALKQREEGEKKQKFDQDVVENEKRLSGVILEALKADGIPQNEYTAAEMADIMDRMLDAGMKPEPATLAKAVKQNNVARARALVSAHTKAIEAGMKNGDEGIILAAGTELAELLGEHAAFALSRYYLAKHRKTQPSLPKQPVDSAKTRPAPAPERKGYMSPDEYAAERKRRVAMMERGEDPGEW